MTRNVRESELEAMRDRAIVAERDRDNALAWSERLQEALTSIVQGVEDGNEELYNNYCDNANKVLKEYNRQKRSN